MSCLWQLVLGQVPCLTVSKQLVIAINVGHCVTPLGKGLVPHLSSRSDGTINRGLFLLHMHSIWHGIKRSWPSTEGGSVIVGVERVSVTYR